MTGSGLAAWEEWGGWIETGATSGLSVSDSGRYFVSSSPSGADSFGVGDVLGLPVIGQAIDIIAGGPQKREREAEALRDAQKYAAEAAAYNLAAAQGGGGGLSATLAAASPIPGLSWGALGLGLVAVAVVLVVASK